MLSKQFIQDYFNSDFRDIDSLLTDVLVPIFGDYNHGYTEITVQTEKAKEMAKAAHIKTIKHVATFEGMGLDIKVFDVTLDDNCRIHQARKNIQALVRQFVEKFEGAFIVFHYEDPTNRSWRFSYLEKRQTTAASTNAKRYTYLCGGQYPCRTLAERFEKLQSQDKTAANLETAFSVEALSNEFFDEYRYFYQDLVNFVKYENDLLDGFIEYANGDKDLAEKYARDYIKKLMGRLVFIQFLQNKAWLDNDIHYTHTLFDKCSDEQRENFLDNILEPLFFGVFNTPKNEREALFLQNHWDNALYEQWKDFPYLNGGLFECDELDKLQLPLPSYFFSNPEKKDHVRTPNDKYYSDACGIFDFFDRYNFTIDESDPLDTEIGVDPEMLGKIFENLLEDNKDKGAFYTPKEIVNYMCREALVAYLIDEARRKSEVNKQRQESFEDAIRAFVTDPEMTVTRMQRYGDQQLKDLNDSLCEVKICDPAIGSGAFPMGLLNLLMNCRVELNKALHKGEPRAWLKKEIIQNNIYGVDIEKGAIDIARLRFWLSIVVDLEEPEALPNFDYKFMQGNSLLEQYNGVDLSQVAEIKKENTDGYQVSMFENELDVCRRSLHDKLEEYFGVTNHLTKQNLRNDISALVQKELDEQHIKVDLSNIDVSANDKFFLWHTWFADVFNRPSKQGFDIVIGNPPYITYKGKEKVNISDVEVKRLIAAYPNSAEYKVNSYALFVEAGLKLCNNRGHLTYIIPSTLLQNEYLKKIRQYILQSHRLRELVSFENKVFNAVTDSMILTCQAGRDNDTSMRFKRVSDLNFTIKQEKTYNTTIWDNPSTSFVIDIKTDSSLSSIFAKMERGSQRLDFYYNVYVGIVANGIKKHLSNSKLSSTYKKYLQGKHIGRFFVNFKSLYINFIPSELHSNTDQTVYEKDEKVLVRKTGNVLLATLDNEQYYTDQSLYNLYLKEGKSYNSKLLVAILNSTLLNLYYNKKFTTNADVFPYIKGIHLKQFPLPPQDRTEAVKITVLVNTILSKKKQNPQADTSAEENAIDKLIYQLYGLSEDEIKQIEKE